VLLVYTFSMSVVSSRHQGHYVILSVISQWEGILVLKNGALIPLCLCWRVNPQQTNLSLCRVGLGSKIFGALNQLKY